MPKTAPTRRNEQHKPQAVPARFKPGFLESLDKRTDVAKALRANYDEIVRDIGGAEELGRVKRVLVERFCWLTAILESIEHELISGDIDKATALGRWIQAVNSLTGLARALGFDRKISMPWATPAEPSNGDLEDK